MPNATFVLKQPKAKTDTLIYLFFRFNGKTLKYSTGQQIHPKFWNAEKQRVKETRQYTGYPELNTLLNNLEATANDSFRNLINDKITPTPDAIRVILNASLQKGSTTPKKALITFAEEMVENSNRKPNTKKQLRQTIRNLNEYMKHIRKTIDFDSIDLEFYDSFHQFLTGKKYGTNTIGTIFKNVKVIMNEAVDRGLTNNLQYKNRRFKTMEEPSESIYLTKDEVKKIYDLNLKTNPRLDRVRDLFIIACYTGLRFSDLSQLKDENFIDKKTKVRVKTEKTSELVIIPLHPFIKQILKKYNGIPPENLSNQKMNEYLKELGDWAGLKDEILITSTKGNERVTEIFKKFQLITTHTARRSFATNAYLNGVPTISIMKITGHRTEKSFMKYIKISQEDNANKLIHHPFFN